MQLMMPKPTKLTRDTFLYLDPKPPFATFAQCETCMMFTGEAAETCTIHGAKVRVTKDHSCGLYVHGTPMPDEQGHEMASVTPEESGLIKAQVRCENCQSFQAQKTTCTLFQWLSRGWAFALNPKVHPHGCCNAWSSS